MKTLRPHKSLTLAKQTLRRLVPPELQTVVGGTVLVDPVDPVTRRPPPITDFTCTCPIRG